MGLSQTRLCAAHSLSRVGRNKVEGLLSRFARHEVVNIPRSLPRKTQKRA